jgi:hypothetical protein
MSIVEKFYGGFVHRYVGAALADPRRTHVAPKCEPRAAHLLVVVRNSFPYGKKCPGCFPDQARAVPRPRAGATRDEPNTPAGAGHLPAPGPVPAEVTL